MPGGFSVAGGVPITVQTLGVMLAGAIGLPLLAGGRGGIGVFFGPSAHYLLGWIVGAFVIGLIVHASGRKPAPWRTLVGMLAGGILVIYAVGIPVQSLVSRLPLGETVLISFAFIPGDLIKAVTATIIVTTLIRAYPRVFARVWASKTAPVPEPVR